MAYRRRSSRSARPTRRSSSRSSYSRRAPSRRSYRPRTSRGGGQTIRIVLQQPNAAPTALVNPQTGEMMAARPTRDRPKF